MNIQFEVNISEESSLRSWGTAFEEIESNLNILNNSCFEIKIRKNDVGPHQKTRIIESSNRYSILEHFYLLLLLPSNIFIEFCNFLFIYLTTERKLSNILIIRLVKYQQSGTQQQWFISFRQISIHSSDHVFIEATLLFFH